VTRSEWLPAQLSTARQRVVVGIASLVALVVLSGSAIGAAGATYPNSMASTGDSITQAYNTGFIPFTDNPSASWSTGTDSSVNSHYLRLLALNPAISGHAFNASRSGARMVDLNGQMAAVVSRQVDYVTVLMGGNDVCQPTVGQMTSVDDFRAQFTTAMTTVTTGSPAARVYVVSIPNVYQLWATLKNNATARFVWSIFGVCQSMLANPLSTSKRDVRRRDQVLQREIKFNAVLEQVCARYPQCRFDGNATFNYAFTASDVSSRDYFHPSLTGQRNLAAGTWAVGFFGP
jgi:lysophospholipase L1-like esterase